MWRDIKVLRESSVQGQSWRSPQIHFLNPTFFPTRSFIAAKARLFQQPHSLLAGIWRYTSDATRIQRDFRGLVYGVLFSLIIPLHSFALSFPFSWPFPFGRHGSRRPCPRERLPTLLESVGVDARWIGITHLSCCCRRSERAATNSLQKLQ